MSIFNLCSENYGKEITRTDFLRFFKGNLTSSPYCVQLINNIGRHDRRFKIREKRTILLKTFDRKEAVDFYNNYNKCSNYGNEAK